MSITANKLDWLIDIMPMMTPISHVNWNNVSSDTSLIYGGRNSSSGAQNAETNFDVVLAAGTWDVEVMVTTNTNAGIVSVQLDGSEVGTIDTYSGSAVNNVRLSVTSVSVGVTGKKRLKLKMATKNASSSSYNCVLSHVQLRRTA